MLFPKASIHQNHLLATMFPKVKKKKTAPEFQCAANEILPIALHPNPTHPAHPDCKPKNTLLSDTGFSLRLLQADALSRYVVLVGSHYMAVEKLVGVRILGVYRGGCGGLINTQDQKRLFCLLILLQKHLKPSHHLKE